MLGRLDTASTPNDSSCMSKKCEGGSLMSEHTKKEKPDLGHRVMSQIGQQLAASDLIIPTRHYQRRHLVHKIVA